MDDASVREMYGSLELEADGPMVAGSYGTCKLTYTAGRIGMDDGSQIKVAVTQTSDWGTPQFDDPSGDNYSTIETSADAAVEASFDPQGYIRPWRNTVTVSVFDGMLDEGDTVTLTLGDRSEGSMGLQMQSYPEDGFEFVGLVDAFETGQPVELADECAVDVVPGPAESLVAVAPSNATAGDTVTVEVRGADYWGNAATGYDGTLTFELDGETLASDAETEDGVARVEVTFETTGVKRLDVFDDERDLATTTNPTVVTDRETDRQTYWGDIHGQSEETLGTGTIQEYFTYARDKAFLDFVSHAGNDFQITDDKWTETQETVRAFHDPGEYVTFLCYEWSANTPNGGDHNVYFLDDTAEIYRSSSWQIADGREKHEGTYPIEELYAQFEGRDDVLIIPHQGGRPSRVRDVIDSDLTPFVEIVSVWGVFEWFGQEALGEKHVGFVGGSDDHTGRPGASYPANVTDWSFPIKGGIMAAKSEGLDREPLWDSFTDRRVYGTTGARILLDVAVGDAMMGETATVDGDPEIDVTVNGTAPVRRIDLFRDDELITSQDVGDGPERIELLWTGARSKNRHKVLDWSGGLNVRSGRVRGVDEFGFDHPDRGVMHRTPTLVEWQSSTAGNYQGLFLDVEGDGATLEVSTGPVTGTVDTDDLDEPQVFDAGHVDASLTARRTNLPSEEDVRLTFSDDEFDGEAYYYVRVQQLDGELAWSSPIAVSSE